VFEFTFNVTYFHKVIEFYCIHLSLVYHLIDVSSLAFVASESYQHAMTMYTNCHCLNKIDVHQWSHNGCGPNIMPIWIGSIEFKLVHNCFISY
jgi:hypothetical protein